jgi:DNA mismatch repair protein MutL
MGRIHVLSDQVANQIAAGEVVDRPASVVKELLENSLDAGATRIVVTVEAGGRRLIRIADDGCGMVRDDALLAFERHATSKLRTSDDLLSIATLGFRGEALPSIASIARVELVTRAAEEEAGTRIDIAGGKMLECEDAGCPVGTTLSVRDLFFNTPARRKFLRSENTELAHVTALVTHYALAHPDKHFELHSATHALLIAPPVREPAERIFQIFGEDTLQQLLPLAAEIDLERAGLPEPPPWKRPEEYQPPPPGKLRVSGFTSKPELQKLNRNSIYCFVNRRLVRDRLLMHAVSEAYRNILPPTSFPVVLLFLEMPPEEVDVNVHPAKTEVRFRQSAWLHDFVRDTLRNKLTLGRPAAGFLQALTTHPNAIPPAHRLPGKSPATAIRRPGKKRRRVTFNCPRPPCPRFPVCFPLPCRNRPLPPTAIACIAPLLPMPRKMSPVLRIARPCTAWLRYGRWASCATPSSSRPTAKGYGLSTSTLPMSGCCLSAYYVSAR